MSEINKQKQIGPYILRYLGNDQEEALPVERYSAVFGFILDLDMSNGIRVLAVQNDRGTDVPGGHTEEKDKTPHDTLKREILEETGYNISPTVFHPLVELETGPTDPKYGDKRMLYLLAKVDSSSLPRLTSFVHVSGFMDFQEFIEKNKDPDRKKLFKDFLQLVEKKQNE